MLGDRASFTLVELLVVIAILAILSVAVVVVLNPAELIKQSRDTVRFLDLNAISKTLSFLEADQPEIFFGTSSRVYISVPDSSPTCASLGLPSLPTGWSYVCASTSTFRKVDGTGWIPVNFTLLSGGSPLAVLPVDAVNTTSSGVYYSYVPGGSWVLTALLESQKYLHSSALNDHGYDPARYETGTDLTLWRAVSGLAGWWPFDEGSGTSAGDSSGNGNSGTLTNGPAWTSGKIGSALQLLNGNSYVTAPNSTSLGVGTSDFSISFWFKNSTSLGSSYWNIVSVKNSYNGSNAGWMFWFRNLGSEGHGLSLRFNAGAGNDIVAGDATDVTTQIADGAWHFVAASVDRTLASVSFYFDGVTVGSVGSAVPAGNLNNTNPLGIGATGIGNQPVPNGFTLDDVRVYNRVLSSAEIQAAYNAAR